MLTIEEINNERNTIHHSTFDIEYDSDYEVKVVPLKTLTVEGFAITVVKRKKDE